MKAKWILVIVLIALLIVFALQNAELVEVRFFTGTARMSKALLLPVTFLFGVLVGWLVSLASRGK